MDVSPPPRVLCYAPYNRWTLHGQWEMTILQGLKHRGAEVQYVLCDGLYSDCDVFWEVTSPRPANACTSCQADVTRLVADMGMDFRWLGRYLTPAEGRAARAWADALTDDELLTASHGTWPIADWVRLSVQSHLRRSTLDLADAPVRRALRSYLYSGLIAAFALDRLLDESDPDVLLLFNGRQSSTRVALELAKARGLRTIVHERGVSKEELTLVENGSAVSLAPVREAWAQWADVPLDAGEAEAIAQLVHARGQGLGLSWRAFTTAPQPLHAVRARLGLVPGRRVWALFTSSDDEIAGDADYASPFPSQTAWIARVIEYARAHPEIDLVVRVHPNTGSRRSTGANRTQLDELERLSAAGLPDNVRMVGPEDDLSSYTLMELCSVGLTWVSTAGLELACRGKQVVVAAGSAIHGTGFVATVTDAETFEADHLDPLLDRPAGAASAEIRRHALRFAHLWWIRMRVPFGLVRMPDPHTGQLTYNSLDELRPGRDAGLDRCVRIVLDGEPVCPPPTAAQRARDTAAEDALLAGFGARRLTALAFAEEVIADATLLQAWAEAFDGRDDATLVIHTLAEHAAALVAVVTEAGLAGDDGPDLLALEADAEVIDGVDAVLSRSGEADALAPPRYDDATIGRLASA
jgi:hypothetical protein